MLINYKSICIICLTYFNQDLNQKNNQNYIFYSIK